MTERLLVDTLAVRITICVQTKYTDRNDEYSLFLFFFFSATTRFPCCVGACLTRPIIRSFLREVTENYRRRRLSSEKKRKSEKAHRKDVCT